MLTAIKLATLAQLQKFLGRRGSRLADVGFYSPLVDVRAIGDEPDRIWPAEPRPCGAIDFRPERHRQLMAELAPLAEAFDYDSTPQPDDGLSRFYDGNSQFASLDARLLFALLRLWKPERIVEIGSGYSTLLMVDVAERFLDASRITAIEPYPRPFLRRLASERRIELLEQRVQDVDLSIFDRLQPGDVLFVDSSHVSKTGSDVNTIVFDVIPRLPAGVHIHFHDIFLPFDYPMGWVLDDARSWNEQYIVRALLMFAGAALQVEFGSAFALSALPDLPASLTGNAPASGGSLWITKLAR